MLTLYIITNNYKSFFIEENLCYTIFKLNFIPIIFYPDQLNINVLIKIVYSSEKN